MCIAHYNNIETALVTCMRFVQTEWQSRKEKTETCKVFRKGMLDRDCQRMRPTISESKLMVECALNRIPYSKRL